MSLSAGSLAAGCVPRSPGLLGPGLVALLPVQHPWPRLPLADPQVTGLPRGITAAEVRQLFWGWQVKHGRTFVRDATNPAAAVAAAAAAAATAAAGTASGHSAPESSGMASGSKASAGTAAAAAGAAAAPAPATTAELRAEAFVDFEHAEHAAAAVSTRHGTTITTSAGMFQLAVRRASKAEWDAVVEAARGGEGGGDGIVRVRGLPPRAVAGDVLAFFQVGPSPGRCRGSLGKARPLAGRQLSSLPPLPADPPTRCHPLVLPQGCRVKQGGVHVQPCADNRHSKLALVVFEGPEEAARAMVRRRPLIPGASLAGCMSGCFPAWQVGGPHRAHKVHWQRLAGNSCRLCSSWPAHTFAAPAAPGFLAALQERDRRKLGEAFGDRCCMLELISRAEFEQVGSHARASCPAVARGGRGGEPGLAL